jgi:hypothetical protein
MNRPKLVSIFLSLIVLLNAHQAVAQTIDNTTISEMIVRFKSDAKGPYKDIRWFCNDGSTVSPQERCPEPGVQRARYKKEVIDLGQNKHIFLGQILSTTEFSDFWDAKYHNSRLKQYQLEKFLRANDNGWVNRRAQFYSGAFQTEDEEAWGISFLTWVLNDPRKLESNYFLIRQSAKDIPHNAESNLSQRVRAVSRDLAEEIPSFMNLRVKIHGQPEQSDIALVRKFQIANTSKLSADQKTKFQHLIKDMESLFAPVTAKDFEVFLKNLNKTSNGAVAINELVETLTNTNTVSERCLAISKTATIVKEDLFSAPKVSAKFALLDASNKLEDLLVRESLLWTPTTLFDQMNKVRCLTQAAAAFGYLEKWEWDNIGELFALPEGENIRLIDLGSYSEQARGALEWSSAMIRGNYGDVVSIYQGFEPLALGFVDDKVRASVLLPLGSAVSELGDNFSELAGFSNNVMGIRGQSSIRGLNSGYAMGELIVSSGSSEDIEVDPTKIYVFDRPPADLKPVGGIATVTEGNLVSHVQLLARNLGIPNAVLSRENLQALLPFSGQQVFYAVSNKGTVILKPVAEMNAEEKALFSKTVRSDDKISVPLDEIELSNPRVFNLRDVNASNSGKLCGPKAANLGQLKQLYPDHVVEGLVIPFSIFKVHFDQIIPGKKLSYWQYLNRIFEKSDSMLTSGMAENEVEVFTLDELSKLRVEIKKMKLLPSFEEELKEKFVSVFGSKMGSVPVFLRSDTNMEDLKDFTGAGLNLTLFNVLEAQSIWQGIKDVWASPYTDRSYRWRQRYLRDQANVFPSILIIPSVNADYSGVMITKGVSSGNTDDITVAFNRGVGGAVEGQASESWTIKSDGSSSLISPAREPEFMSIPATGGTLKIGATFEGRVLTEDKLLMLKLMAEQVKNDLSSLGIHGPYDLELGFKDNKLWLFQVRPFVENKKAAATEYLTSISPTLNSSKLIPLNTNLQ